MIVASPFSTTQRNRTESPSQSYSAQYQHWAKEQFNKVIAEQQRKFIAKNLNPFNLCPAYITFWFPTFKYTAIGVTIYNFKRITIKIRQQIEPNETTYLSFTILQLQLPFPLTLLTLFSGLGLFVNGAINNLMEGSNAQLINEQEELLNKLEEKICSLSSDAPVDPSEVPPDIQEKVMAAIAEEKSRLIQQAINPFVLFPRLAFFFPVYKQHTTIAVNFLNFQRIAIAIVQALEPHDIITIPIRFIELKVPFSLGLLAQFLAIGLLLNNGVNQFEQTTRDGIVSEVKQIHQQYRKQ